MIRNTSASMRRYVSVIFTLLLILLAAGCTFPEPGQNEEAGITGPPSVIIAAPMTDASYANGLDINLLATINNAGEDISRVTITLNGSDVQTLDAPNPENTRSFTISEPLAAPGIGEHTLSVTAFRADDSASEPATINFSVVDASAVVIQRGQSLPTATPLPSATAAPTNTPTATPTATVESVDTGDDSNDAGDSSDTGDTGSDSGDNNQPTAEPTNTPTATLTATPAVPVAFASSAVNVRRGPSTQFAPPIGALGEGEQAEILALHTNNGWLKIRWNTNGEAWVLGSIVDIQGDVSGLPRESGPPIPTPVPPTAIPATPTSAVSNNLVPVQPFIDPPLPNCGQDFRAGITIRNDGSATMSTGITRIDVVHIATGQVLGTSGDALVAVTLPPGGTHSVAFTFNISSFYGELHQVRFIADANNQVGETIEGDNTLTVDYTLQQAGCP